MPTLYYNLPPIDNPLINNPHVIHKSLPAASHEIIPQNPHIMPIPTPKSSLVKIYVQQLTVLYNLSPHTTTKFPLYYYLNAPSFVVQKYKSLECGNCGLGAEVWDQNKGRSVKKCNKTNTGRVV